MISLVDYAINVDSNSKNIPLNIVVEKTHTPTNPTIIKAENGFNINFRCIDYFLYNTYGNDKYSLKSDGWHTFKKQFSCDSINHTCYYDNNFNLIIERKIVDNFDGNKISNFKGLEDAQIVCWNDKLYLCGTRVDVKKDNSFGRIVVYELDQFFNVVKTIVVKNVGNEDFREKHWSPIEDRPFSFVRWIDPLEIVTINESGDIVNRTISKSMKIDDKEYRGSTQTVRYKNGYLSIVHTSNLNILPNTQCNNRYRHYFVLYDERLNHIVKISKPFVFRTPDVEFCGGLCVDGDDVYVSYSIKDSCSFVLKTSSDVIDNLFEHNEINNTLLNMDEYYDIANKAYNNKELYKAIAFYNYVFTNTKNKEIEYDSLCKYILCILKLNTYGCNYLNEYIEKLIDILISINVERFEGYFLKSVINKKDKIKNSLYKEIAFTKELKMFEFAKYFNGFVY